jgi:uncharacterized membrane protein YGL010W
MVSVAPLPPLTLGLVAAHLFCFIILAVDILAAVKFENSEAALAFYGVYHRNPWNQLIHFVGVPLILGSAFVFSAHSKLPILLPTLPFIAGGHYLNWATLLFVFYNVFYLSIDVFGAVLYAPILYAFYVLAVRLTDCDQKVAKQENKLVPWTGTGRVLRYAFWVQMLGWYVQIHPGHKILEGASPAVFQSLGGALTTAPFFAFYEGVWWLGLRQDYQQTILELVNEYTAELCAQGATMRACSEALLSS